MSGNTFPGRLDWKMRHYGMPVTSTPKRPMTTVNSVSQKDIQTCFGFDESEEENYSALISPIVMARDKPQGSTSKVNFKRPEKNQVQYGKVFDDHEGAMHFESAKLKNTYASKKLESQKVTRRDTKKLKTTSRKKRTTPLNKADSDSDMDPETKKLLEKKNKEFDDVFHQTCFGFDESEEENYSALVSPIVIASDKPHASTSKVNFKRPEKNQGGFNALLVRYGKVVDDDEGAMHFDSAKLKHTYASKKRESLKVTRRDMKKFKTTTRKKRTSIKNKTPLKKTGSDSDIDLETKKWLEKKNKEFDDVLHVPLIVQKQHTKKK